MGWLLRAASRFRHFYAWRRGYTLLSLFAGVRMRTRVCLSLLCTAGCFEEGGFLGHELGFCHRRVGAFSLDVWVVRYAF